MLRKLRQMAQIQTRVVQRGERGLALQSGVAAGHRPAPHLLVFSKAPVCYFVFLQSSLQSDSLPQNVQSAVQEGEGRPRTGCQPSSQARAPLCMQNEVVGWTEARGASAAFQSTAVLKAAFALNSM